MKVCHLKIEKYMISTNEEKFIKIENIDFENDLVFLHYENDIFIGCRCVIYDTTGTYIYVFYSSSSNKLDNTYFAIEFRPVTSTEHDLFVIREYKR